MIKPKVGFAAQVKMATGKMRKRTEFVWRKSVYDIGEMAQTTRFEGGRLPYLTGRLQRSFKVVLKNTATFRGADAHVMASQTTRIGQSLRFSWEAYYAHFQEFGWTDMRGVRHPGRFFARGAAQMWPKIVSYNAELSKKI